MKFAFRYLIGILKSLAGASVATVLKFDAVHHANCITHKERKSVLTCSKAPLCGSNGWKDGVDKSGKSARSLDRCLRDFDREAIQYGD